MAYFNRLVRYAEYFFSQMRLLGSLKMPDEHERRLRTASERTEVVTGVSTIQHALVVSRTAGKYGPESQRLTARPFASLTRPATHLYRLRPDPVGPATRVRGSRA